MHRLARSVLVVVALFVVLVVALLVTRSRTTAVDATSSPSGPRADLRMKEVDIEEQTGNVRWRLRAEQALVYETEGRTSLRNISVVVQGRDRSWTIVADEGDVQDRAPKVRDIEVRKNVVVTTSDGNRLDTSVLRWDGARKRLWTDAPVKLAGKSGVIQGTGFELDTDDESSRVLAHVRATFDQRGAP